MKENQKNLFDSDYKIVIDYKTIRNSLLDFFENEYRNLSLEEKLILEKLYPKRWNIDYYNWYISKNDFENILFEIFVKEKRKNINELRFYDILCEELNFPKHSYIYVESIPDYELWAGRELTEDEMWFNQFDNDYYISPIYMIESLKVNGLRQENLSDDYFFYYNGSFNAGPEDPWYEAISDDLNISLENNTYILSDKNENIYWFVDDNDNFNKILSKKNFRDLFKVFERLYNTDKYLLCENDEGAFDDEFNIITYVDYTKQFIGKADFKLIIDYKTFKYYLHEFFKKQYRNLTPNEICELDNKYSTWDSKLYKLTLVDENYEGELLEIFIGDKCKNIYELYFYEILCNELNFPKNSFIYVESIPDDKNRQFKKSTMTLPQLDVSFEYNLIVDFYHFGKSFESNLPNDYYFCYKKNLIESRFYKDNVSSQLQLNLLNNTYILTDDDRYLKLFDAKHFNFLIKEKDTINNIVEIKGDDFLFNIFNKLYNSGDYYNDDDYDDSNVNFDDM